MIWDEQASKQKFQIGRFCITTLPRRWKKCGSRIKFRCNLYRRPKGYLHENGETKSDGFCDCAKMTALDLHQNHLMKECQSELPIPSNEIIHQTPKSVRAPILEGHIWDPTHELVTNKTYFSCCGRIVQKSGAPKCCPKQEEERVEQFWKTVLSIS